MHAQITFNMDSGIISKNILVLIISILLFPGCEKICDCAKSTGEIQSEIRYPASFNRIELNNNIDLIVHIDSIPKIKITAGKNLISEIETTIDNGTLKISNKNNCNWVRDFNPKIVAEIWTPSLNALWIEDATGDIYFEDSLDCNPFVFDSFSSTGVFHFKLKGEEARLNINTGSADINATGKVTNFYLYGAGYGKLDCVNLQSDFVFVTNKGTNNFYVDAQQLLEASIFGVGNIYYKGSPASIVKKEFSKGKLISL